MQGIQSRRGIGPEIAPAEALGSGKIAEKSVDVEIGGFPWPRGGSCNKPFREERQGNQGERI